ncbi:hypothetical protein Fmac_009226 [Flemingia macrophylla]|uniref:Uncharacterized protein n=1 Tax=Flemingia macrophylla TaxID=520843 RepID=A0ABD1MZM6_9FABA
MEHCFSTRSASTQASHCEKASSFKKRWLNAAKEQRSRLYILKSPSSPSSSSSLSSCTLRSSSSLMLS